MVTFLELFRKYINHHETSLDIFDKRKPGTIRAYNAKYSLITSFLLERSSVHIKACAFDLSLSKTLAEWMANKKYNHNYIVRVRHICKTVLQFGAQNELIKSNPLIHLKLKKQQPAAPPFLNIIQIESLINYLPASLKLQKAKMMAIIQLDTAFDYSDFAEITREHKCVFNNREYIIKPRNKNGNEQVIPLTERLKSHLEMLNYNICLLGNQKYNDSLKAIFSDLNFNINANSKAMRKIALGNKLNNEQWSMDATALFAGHKSGVTTEKYYVQRKINLISNQLDLLQNQTQLQFSKIA